MSKQCVLFNKVACATLRYTALHCATLRYTALHCATLRYTALCVILSAAAQYTLHSSCAVVTSGGANVTALTTSVNIVQTPPQFTNISMCNNTNTGALCTTSLNVTDSTVVLDMLTPGQYDNLHDYNAMLRSNRSMFPTYGNELILTFTSGVSNGGAVALSGDGSTLAVGSNIPNNIGGSSGIVYIYRRINNTWAVVQQLQSPLPNDNTPSTIAKGFGMSLALSYDGQTLAVGRPLGYEVILNIGLTPQPNATPYVFLYTYQPSSTQYTLVQTISGSSVSGFGRNVSLSATGQYLVIDDSSINFTFVLTSAAVGQPYYNPSVRVYERQNSCSGVNSWQQTSVLTVTASANCGSNSSFARQPFQSTALSADGTTIAIVWPAVILNGSFANGQMAIFKRQGGTWQQTQITTLQVQEPTDITVSLSADGKYLAVGVCDDVTVAPTNAVYVFAQQGTTYQQEAILTGPNASTTFGYSVSLSADGTVLTVGGNTINTNSGVTVFLRGPNNTWSQQFAVATNDNLGYACATSADGNIIVAGATQNLLSFGYVTLFRPIGSYVPNDTVVSGSLCVYKQTTINSNLKVAGNIHVQNTIVTGTAGHVSACTIMPASDARIKNNITPLDAQRALEVIRSLRPVTFDWNNPDPFDTKLLRNFTQGERGCPIARTECFSKQSEEKCIERMSDSSSTHYAGFIAQELEKQFPHWVKTDLSPDGEVKMIYLHQELYAYLVSALLEVTQRTQENRARINALSL